MIYDTVCRVTIGLCLKSANRNTYTLTLGMKTEKEGKERYMAKYYCWLSLGRIAYRLFLLCIPSCIFQIFYNEHIYHCSEKTIF